MITLTLTPDAPLITLANAVYQTLIAADCPDLAQQAEPLHRQARDADEYVKAVLRLSDELKVEWR